MQKQHSQRLMEAECEDDDDDSGKHAPHSETTPLFKAHSNTSEHDPYFKPHSSISENN